jgi:hypothetical protein
MPAACGDSCRICNTFDELERNASMALLGCTAIEDKLQKLASNFPSVVAF